MRCVSYERRCSNVPDNASACIKLCMWMQIQTFSEIAAALGEKPLCEGVYDSQM